MYTYLVPGLCISLSVVCHSFRLQMKSSHLDNMKTNVHTCDMIDVNSIQSIWLTCIKFNQDLNYFFVSSFGVTPVASQTWFSQTSILLNYGDIGLYDLYIVQPIKVAHWNFVQVSLFQPVRPNLGPFRAVLDDGCSNKTFA